MCNERKLEAISKPSIIIRLYVMETKNKLKESKVNRRQPTEISVRLCRFVCLNVCICGGINLVPSCLLTIPFSFSKYLSLCPSISLASLPPCVISLIGRQGPIINWYKQGYSDAREVITRWIALSCKRLASRFTGAEQCRQLRKKV